MSCWCCSNITTQAQSGADYSAIKLYLDYSRVGYVNKDLSPALQNRLCTKITGLINQAGIAEIGYSTFVVVPRFDILNTSVDESGMARVFMTEAELSITIERRSYGTGNGAVYASVSKRIIGSGMSKEESQANAINGFSPSDKELVSFMEQSKAKITAYFQAHCHEVLAEARQAYAMNDYGRSIALYFSIPSNAPSQCYREATAACKVVYSKYMEDECNKKLIGLKALVARALDDNAPAGTYEEAIKLIRDLDPASGDCYEEAKMVITKIENRFDEKQKREWEMKKKQLSDATEIQKGAIKAMARINSSYQQSSSPTVIIAK